MLELLLFQNIFYLKLKVTKFFKYFINNRLFYNYDAMFIQHLIQVIKLLRIYHKSIILELYQKVKF